MPQFGKRSRANLETCHDDIRVVLESAIRLVDFTVLEGRRSKELQNLYYSQGKSQLQWPHSKHNVINPQDLSDAVDIAPWPIDWQDHKRFILVGGIILGVAHTLDIPMRWGGDWNGDFKFNESFLDMPHFELVNPS